MKIEEEVGYQDSYMKGVKGIPKAPSAPVKVYQCFAKPEPVARSQSSK